MFKQVISLLNLSCTIFLSVLFGGINAEESDFGVQFDISQYSSLIPYQKALNSDVAAALSLRIGSADRQLLSHLDTKEVLSSIQSDLLFTNVLSLMKFKFSHFALFEDVLVAVYRPVNALTGQPDKESQRAVQEIARRLREDFKQALNKQNKIAWSVVYTPYIRELGRINGEAEISIDFRDPLFFVVLKKNADTSALEKALEYQAALSRSPAVIKARPDQAAIFVEDYD